MPQQRQFEGSRLSLGLSRHTAGTRGQGHGRVLTARALLIALIAGSCCLVSLQISSPVEAAPAQTKASIPETVQQKLDSYMAELEAFRTAGNHAEEAKTLNKIGLAYYGLSKLQQALSYYSQALQLFRGDRNHQGEAVALNNIGLVYRDLGDRQKALEYYQQALPLLREVGDRLVEATTLNNIGAVYAARDDPQRALEDYMLALPLRRAVGDREGEGVTLNNIGAAYVSLGERRRGLDYYNQALQLRRSVGDQAGEAATLTNFGMTYFVVGELRKALEYYMQALSLNRAIGRQIGEARSLNAIGIVHWTLGDPESAQAYYRQALQLFRVIGDRSGQAVTLNNIGKIYADAGEQAKAEECYKQAQLLFRAAGEPSSEGIALINIGKVHSDLGEQQEAEKYYNQALELFRKAIDPFGEAKALKNLAYSDDLMQKSRKASGEYYQSLTLAISAQDPLLQADILSFLMRHWDKAGSPSLAIFFGKHAVDAYQRVRRNLQGIDKELIKSFVSSKASTYRQLADLLVAQGRLPEAREVLDLLKEEEYKDFVRGETKTSSESVSLNSQEKKSTSDLQKLTDKIAADGQRWLELGHQQSRTEEEEQEYRSLSEKIYQANKHMDQFFDQLFQQFTPTANSQAANHQVSISRDVTGSLQRLVRELGSGNVALYTLVVDNHYRVIVITPSVMVDREAAITSDELRRKVLAFTEKLRDPSSDPLPEAQALYKVLVAPVENDLKSAHAQTLVWSLDDVLRYVPVAALHDGQQYLVQRFRSVVITPASLLHLDKRPALANAQALALGIAKQYEAALNPLENVETELDAIVRDPRRASSAKGVVPGLIELDDDFTEKTMAAQLAQQKYALVHIASHFVFTPGNDTDSYLLLAGKDVGGPGYHLTMQEVNDEPSLKQAFEGVDLLTLSACNTATSRVPRDGKEVDGLATTIHRNGARAVIATLWKADDAATAEFMVSFYRHWISTAGIPKVQALQDAQLDLIRGSVGANQPTAAKTPNFAHPYYWAPFILMGNWN